MPAVKSQLYKDFKENKGIVIFTRDMLLQTIYNISKMYREGKFQRDYHRPARAFMIILWITGARPGEILNLTAKNVFKTDTGEIAIEFKTSKGGNPRQAKLPSHDELVNELWEYASSITLPEMFIFHMFRSKRIRTNVKVTRKSKNPITGEMESKVVKDYTGRVYENNSDKILRLFKRWVSGILDNVDGMEISPYYLRHSRISVIADEDGIDIEDIRIFKGAKDYRSCQPYMHATPKKLKKLGEAMLK
jgi:integrase